MSLRQSLRFIRAAPTTNLLNKRLFATMAEPRSSTERSKGDTERIIEDRLTSKFGSDFKIHNDSHLHKHHKSMAGSTSTETHFRLVIVSDEFQGKPQLKRHRMVNELFQDYLSEGKIHALQLRTMTKQEQEKKPTQE